MLAMFGLGTTEILIIVVVALIAIGPAKLPELARSLGKGMRELRRVGDEFQREMSRAAHEDDAESSSPPARPARPQGDATPPPPHRSDPTLGTESHGEPGASALEAEPRPAPGAVAREHAEPTEPASDLERDVSRAPRHDEPPPPSGKA